MVNGLPFHASMRMALTGQALAASTAWGTSSGGMGPGWATASMPSIWNTAGQSPAHWGAADAQVQGQHMRSS